MNRHRFLTTVATLAGIVPAASALPIPTRVAEYAFDPANPGLLRWKGAPCAFIGAPDDPTKPAPSWIRSELLNNLNS